MSEVPPPPPDAGGVPVWNVEQLTEVLRCVYDPDLHINIVDLGLVYDVALADRKVSVKMTLTSPACPYGPYLLSMVKETLLALKGIEGADVQVVWEPPWGPHKMSEETRLELGFDL